MPKVKRIPIVAMGSKAGYAIPLTVAQKKEIEAMAVEFSNIVEKKYPGMDYSLVIGPYTTVNGCTTALVLQILNLISVLVERIDDSEEGTKIANAAAQLLCRLMPLEPAQKICKYYDGEVEFDRHKIHSPEAKA